MINGVVSPESAGREYGVSISTAGVIDWPATMALRTPRSEGGSPSACPLEGFSNSWAPEAEICFAHVAAATLFTERRHSLT